MNRFEARAAVLEREPLRHTPAGLPALELVLAHESEVIEAGHPRRVELTIKAVALGDLALLLADVQIGSTVQGEGFLAPTRKNGTRIKWHLQRAQVVSAGIDPVIA